MSFFVVIADQPTRWRLFPFLSPRGGRLCIYTSWLRASLSVQRAPSASFLGMHRIPIPKVWIITKTRLGILGNHNIFHLRPLQGDYTGFDPKWPSGRTLPLRIVRNGPHCKYVWLWCGSGSVGMGTCSFAGRCRTFQQVILIAWEMFLSGGLCNRFDGKAEWPGCWHERKRTLSLSLSLSL